MADNTNPQDYPIVTRAEARAAGAKRYFTGKPCKHGHIAERLVSNGWCLICATIQQNAYRAKSPGKMVATQIAYRAANREKQRARCAAWRAANPAKSRASVAKWTAANTKRINAKRRLRSAANKEKSRTRRAIYAEATREKRRARDAAVRAAYPEKHRAYNTNRRARKLLSGGKHSAADIVALVERQRGKCAHPWCRKPLSDGYNVDHILPLSIGGSNGPRNLQLLCVPCNRRKYNTHPIDYAQRHGMLL